MENNLSKRNTATTMKNSKNNCKKMHKPENNEVRGRKDIYIKPLDFL